MIGEEFHHWISTTHLGRLPLAVVWFGAMGGSLASLTGIYWHHETDWKASYNLWHQLRPWTGLVMGTFGAFLLLVSTELATTGSSTGAAKTLNPDIYYAAALAAGFAENPFRVMLKRVTDAIFGPGKSNPKQDDHDHN